MKEAIENAIKGGMFETTRAVVKIQDIRYKLYKSKEMIEIRNDSVGGGFAWCGSIHDLIFSTDFIECLVGEGSPDCGVYGGRCIRTDKPRKQEDYIHCRGNKETWANSCKYLCGWYDAGYHRSQMANIKDIEKLKEYIGGLI